MVDYVGTSGDDVFPGVDDDNSGDDTIHGRQGDDFLSPGAGVDFVDGGAGDDTIALGAVTAQAGDHYRGGSGVDTLLIGVIPPDEPGPHGGYIYDLTGVTIEDDIEILRSTYPGQTLAIITTAQLMNFRDVQSRVEVIGAGTLDLRRTQVSALSLDDGDHVVDLSRNLRGASVAGGFGADRVTGSAFADFLSGGGGVDDLRGAGGDDILAAGYGSTLVGGRGNDRLTVSGEGNTLSGGDGDDILTGSGRGNTLDGGGGDDRIAIDVGALPAPESSLSGGRGYDVLQINGVSAGQPYVDLTQLPADFEEFVCNVSVRVTVAQLAHTKVTAPNLHLADAGDITAENIGISDGYYPRVTLADGTNRLDLSGATTVFFVVGGAGGDTVTGGDAGNFFNGGAGDDVLRGGAGADGLNGGAGRDELYGGDGGDRLTAGWSGQAGEVFDGGGGEDTLSAHGDMTGATIAGIEYFETDGYLVTFTAAQMAGFSRIYGRGGGTIALATGGAVTVNLDGPLDLALSDFGNTVAIGPSSWGGAITVHGGAGVDHVSGGSGNDVFTQVYADFVPGDSFDGGAGSDALIVTGGAADSPAIDLTTSISVETIDIGVSTARITAALLDGATALTGNFIVTTAGAISLAGVRNGRYDIDGAPAIYTLSDLGNTIDFTGAINGSATVIGGRGNDTIIVGSLSAASLVHAGDGQDIVTGGAGKDVIEGDGGRDTLRGLGGDDYLSGGAGGDLLAGGAGDDTLAGGAGHDRFLFDGALGAGNLSRILDFATAGDTILLDRSIFAEAGPLGQLPAEAFATGSAAHDADDRIIYDAASGDLFYDADGTGAGAQVLFAHLTAGAVLTHADIVIVG